MEENRPPVELEQQLMRELGIKLGYPSLPAERAKSFGQFDFETIDLPYSPHIFYIPQLKLNTWVKQRRETIEPAATLENVMAIIGHGWEVSNNGKKEWRFIGTDKPVEDTVVSYQKFAKEHSLPPIDVVLVCRGMEIVPPLPSKPGVIEVRKAPAPIKVKTEDYAPYIFPNDYVGAVGTISKSNREVQSVIANTEHWQGIKERQGYWGTKQRLNVPSWAKAPAR